MSTLLTMATKHVPNVGHRIVVSRESPPAHIQSLSDNKPPRLRHPESTLVDISHALPLQAVSGMMAAFVSASLFGIAGAPGFAIGSCVGFVASTMVYWNTTLLNAYVALDAYPTLMRLHLIRNYRTHGFERLRLETRDDVRAFREKLAGDLSLRCILMSAWQTAGSAIEVRDEIGFFSTFECFISPFVSCSLVRPAVSRPIPSNLNCDGGPYSQRVDSDASIPRFGPEYPAHLCDACLPMWPKEITDLESRDAHSRITILGELNKTLF